MSDPIPLVNTVLNTVRQVRWDTPYRLLASLAGLAALGAGLFLAPGAGTPLEGARAATSWLGFSVDANLTAAERWLLEPDRWQVLVIFCGVVALLAVASLWVHATHRDYGLANLESRAGATFVLAYAGLVQLGACPWWAFLAFGIGLVVLWCVLLLLGRDDHEQRVFDILWSTTCTGLPWAVWFVGGWAVVPAAPDPAERDPQTPPPDTSGSTGGATGSRGPRRL